MSSLLKINILGFLLLNLISCSGQRGEEKPSLSDDFDKSFPFYFGITDNITSQDTSSGWEQNGQKILITGTVYKGDGKTPAPNVIIYYYHTDIDGRYIHHSTYNRSMPPNKLGQTHGYIRGWVQTGPDGKYSIYTVRPGTYPSRDEPAHIHVNIKEPQLSDDYYIDEFMFDDDKQLSASIRKEMDNRGGSGVLRLVEKGHLHIGERDIILGLNIPDYTEEGSNQNQSGKQIGEDVLSFTPYHAWGPDKETKTCPICKYGWYHGILYFVGNHPNWDEIKEWLIFLEAESKHRKKYLKIYFVYGNENGFNKAKRIARLQNLGEELNLSYVALTFVPSLSDKQSDIYLNEINPELENTFILYKRSKVIDKFINLKPSPKNFKMILDRLDETINEYFDLAKPNNK